MRVQPMTPGIPRAARLRAYLAGATLTLGLFGVALRAWGLQISDGDHYRALASRQHELAVAIPAPRGDVIDSRGRPLAVSADTDSIWANPREIRDVTETAAKLARLLSAEPAALEAKLAGAKRFIWLARHVTPELARAIRRARLPGIDVAREPRRWYPGRAAGGPVLGRADIDGNGLDGVELALNAELHGKRGEGTAVRDVRGRRMFADGLAQPEPGATVQLTLDRSIQAIADAALTDAILANQARNGSVVVLDVATSRVLAMASYPSYDSNTGIGIAGGARNRPVTDVYEAGSVMKIFTIAAALDAGAVRPDTELDVQGPLIIGPKPIRDVHADKYLTTTGIIKRSSNIGAVKIAQRLGKERLHAALLAFGFGSRTDIELPGEQRGLIRPGERWREIELATIAFGYGLTVTPLQVAAGIAAIGNHGLYRAPRIVDRIIEADGTTRTTPLPPSRRVVTSATADAMRIMLGTPFEGGRYNGTASSIVVPGFRCAGKTGTAHKYDPVLKKYADNRYLSTFAGLAPLDNPVLAIVVFVDEPSGGDYYGGKVAGPVFATVASESLRYLNVPGESLYCPPPPPGVNPALITTPRTCTMAMPRVAPPSEPTPTPEFVGMGLGRALDAARAANLAPTIIGSGRVVSQQIDGSTITLTLAE